jgi:hypothetical protein
MQYKQDRRRFGIDHSMIASMILSQHARRIALNFNLSWITPIYETGSNVTD